MDAVVQSPVFPKLCAGVEAIPVADGKVLLRGGPGTLMLGGAFVEQVLMSLIKSFDGKNAAHDLAERIENAFHPEFWEFLDLMVEKGFLEYSCLDVAEPWDHGPENSFWSLHAESPEHAAKNLSSAHIVVGCSGQVGSVFANAMTEGGVGDLTLVTESAKSLRAEQNISTNVKVIEASAKDAPWSMLAQDASLIAICHDTMSLVGFDAINEMSIEMGVPWVGSRIDRNRALIGPFVFPHETACFTCYELRNRVNADHSEDHEALFNHWRTSAPVSPDWPLTKSLASVVGNWLAADVLRHLAGQHLPVTAGRLVELDFSSLHLRTHEILKLPRCPSCSRLRAQPMKRIWDIAQKKPMAEAAK